MNFASQSLPYGERYQCKTGILPENVQKNRFKTTYTCMYQISRNDTACFHSDH